MAAQREWYEKDYYQVLGVADDATSKDITKAYRKLAREFHPDKNPGDSAAEERFKEVSAAYDVLGDDTKRAEYDEVRRLGPMAGMRGGGGPGGGFRFNVGDMGGAGGFGDILGNMFGRRGGSDRWGRGGAAARQRHHRRAHRRLRRRRRGVSRPRCSSPATRSAPPVTAAAPSPARARGCVATAADAVWSTTTRASSRSRPRATCAVARDP